MRRPFRPMEYGHSPVFFEIGRFAKRSYVSIARRVRKRPPKEPKVSFTALAS
jgi:hypothetical protein